MGPDDGPEGRVGHVVVLARAAGVALLAGLAACALEAGPGPIGGAALPSRAPVLADRDHADLVAAFGGEYRAVALADVLRETTAALVARSERPEEAFAVTILDSAKVNAFALPGGHLYVTRGLLALASDGDEVAAVLAHEMAHVTRRHAQSRSEQEARAALVSRVTTEVLGDPAGGARIEESGRSALASFSRAQEFEADALGIATLASAGYDPFAASRFLRALGRQANVDAGLDPDAGSAGGGAEQEASHPATPRRIALATAAARRLGSATSPQAREEARQRWLSAIEGLAYGDPPSRGVVRGRRFLHPRLGIAFEAPDGIALENTSRAVLGASRDGAMRLLFDAVAAPADKPSRDLLTARWSDPIDPASLVEAEIGGRNVTLASSRGGEWTFRLAAVRIGETGYRLVLGARGNAVRHLDAARAATLSSLRVLSPEEVADIRPLRIATIIASPGDTVARMAARMATDRSENRFLPLNGVERGAALVEGRRYKIVVE